MNDCEQDGQCQNECEVGKVSEKEKKFSVGYRMSAPDFPTLAKRQWEHVQGILTNNVWDVRRIVEDIVLESVQWEGERWERAKGESSGQMNAAEALFGFMSWLSTRDVSVSIGSRHDCAVLPELIMRFLATNKLPGVRENWHEKFSHPCDYLKE